MHLFTILPILPRPFWAGIPLTMVPLRGLARLCRKVQQVEIIAALAAVLGLCSGPPDQSKPRLPPGPHIHSRGPVTVSGGHQAGPAGVL